MQPTSNTDHAGVPGEPPPPPPAPLPGAADSPRAPGRGGAGPRGPALLVAVAIVSGMVGLAIGRLSAGGDAAASAAPSFAGASAAGEQPSLTPPAASADEPGAGAGQVVDVENIAIVLPEDWTVVRADPSSIEVRPPDGIGSLVLDTGRGFASVQALQDAIISALRMGNPSLEVCSEPEPAGVPGGPPDGSSFALCYTVESEGGEPIAFGSAHLIGIDAPIGTAPANAAWFSYALLAPASEMPRLLELADTLPPPTWKLYGG